ncbi:MAG TPA: sigma-70 family RNA polymerase sigma factor [Gemmatimonadaceae bacterium]|jgi:RNA polymerase sigma-70 factor (ECF subfamily)
MARDVESFERLVLPHLDDAYALACMLLRNDTDAQDVVQEAMLRALRFYEGHRDGNERAWLLTIVRNCCFTWHRRRLPDRMSVSYTDAESAPQLHDHVAVDAGAVRASEQAAINRALHLLPEEYREVIVLRDVQDLSYREIADVVGVPMGTVMSRLARGRKRLASLLRPHIREAS